ncbi:hypothetical protein ABZT04_31145 [Streptomyces sp. NPDC005492]|uniref:hypothetical protein n=1 Tax=Streptomyces sp. NPDC005492 TaxID=3156883 RepID=UPI0033A7D9C5
MVLLSAQGWFAVDGTGCAGHEDQGSMIRRYYGTSRFLVCWWYTACMALTSANVTADVDLAVSGPHMVRILVVG